MGRDALGGMQYAPRDPQHRSKPPPPGGANSSRFPEHSARACGRHLHRAVPVGWLELLGCRQDIGHSRRPLCGKRRDRAVTDSVPATWAHCFGCNPARLLRPSLSPDPFTLPFASCVPVSLFVSRWSPISLWTCGRKERGLDRNQAPSESSLRIIPAPDVPFARGVRVTHRCNPPKSLWRLWRCTLRLLVLPAISGAEGETLTPLTFRANTEGRRAWHVGCSVFP